MQEQWKDIKGYEELYQVSNLGKIKSLPRIKQNGTGCYYTKEKILKPRKDKNGYHTVILWKDKKGKSFKIHRLVAMTFIENPNNYPEVNHKDENKKNNSVSNLEWCDRLYNMRYGTWHEERIKKTKKPVLQFDKQNNAIKLWSSITEAAKTLNIHKSCISGCCRGKHKTGGGFRWAYVEIKGGLNL